MYACVYVCVCVLSFYPSLYFDRVLFLLPLQTCPRHYLVYFFITLESSKTTLFSLSLNILLLFYLSKTEWTVVTLTFRACLTSFKWLLSHTYQSHCYDPSLFFSAVFLLNLFLVSHQQNNVIATTLAYIKGFFAICHKWHVAISHFHMRFPNCDAFLECFR